MGEGRTEGPAFAYAYKRYPIEQAPRAKEAFYFLTKEIAYDEHPAQQHFPFRPERNALLRIWAKRAEQWDMHFLGKRCRTLADSSINSILLRLCMRVCVMYVNMCVYIFTCICTCVCTLSLEISRALASLNEKDVWYERLRNLSTHFYTSFIIFSYLSSVAVINLKNWWPLHFNKLACFIYRGQDILIWFSGSVVQWSE